MRKRRKRRRERRKSRKKMRARRKRHSKGKIYSLKTFISRTFLLTLVVRYVLLSKELFYDYENLGFFNQFQFQKDKAVKPGVFWIFTLTIYK